MYPNTTRFCVKKILAALEQDSRINTHQSHIQVFSTDNTIILEGSVPDITGKRLTNSIARKIVNGDFFVEDRLCIDGEAMGDNELKNKISHILGNEPIFFNHTIAIRTDDDLEIIHDTKANSNRILASIRNGIISLSGKVNSVNHRRFAEVLMWWIPGCLQVNNALEVVPPQWDDDNTLTDAVRMVLEKDPLVHASQITVGTHSGIVELYGFLPNEDEHGFAIRDTWTVPGVEGVRDHISVGAF